MQLLFHRYKDSITIFLMCFLSALIPQVEIAQIILFLMLYELQLGPVACLTLTLFGTSKYLMLIV